MPTLHALKTWYSPERQGFITLEDDVLGIVSQIRELYGNRISIEFDEDHETYTFVEHGEDGTDRLIFQTNELDQRAVTRLMLADSHSRHFEDPYDAAEREQDELDRRKEDEQREVVSAMGEELIFHLQKEGKAPFLTKPVYMTESLPDADS